MERIGQNLLRVFRSVVSELQLRFEQWPELLPFVTTALNNAPPPSQNNISPITAFMYMDATPPIATFPRTETTTVAASFLESSSGLPRWRLKNRRIKESGVTPVTIEEIWHERLLNVQFLKNCISELLLVV